MLKPLSLILVIITDDLLVVCDMSSASYMKSTSENLHLKTGLAKFLSGKEPLKRRPA